MSVQEYSLKFISLSMYASSLVSNPRDEMSHFVMGVSDDVVEECRAAMIHDSMEIFRLKVHAQIVEKSRLKRKNRNAMRARPYDGVTSKGKFKFQDKPKFKKRFSNKVPSNFSNDNKDRVYNPKP